MVEIMVRPDESGCFVGVSEPFGVPGFGATVDEAFQSALDATTLYLETLDAEGVRESVFKDRNVLFHNHEPGDPQAVSIEVEPGAFASPQRVSLLASCD